MSWSILLESLFIGPEKPQGGGGGGGQLHIHMSPLAKLGLQGIVVKCTTVRWILSQYTCIATQKYSLRS